MAEEFLEGKIIKKSRKKNYETRVEASSLVFLKKKNYLHTLQFARIACMRFTHRSHGDRTIVHIRK